MRRTTAGEWAVMAALGLLGLTFALELKAPLFRFAQWGTLTNVEALAIGAVVMWGLVCALERRFPRWPPKLGPAAATWLAVIMMATFQAPGYRLEALHFALKVAMGALVGWAVYDVTTTSRRLAWLGRAFALGGLVVALAALAEAGQLEPVATWLGAFKAAPTRAGEFRRASATLPYATIAGAVLEMTAFFWLAWTLSASSRPGRWLAAGGVLVTVVGLVLTLSRAAVLALLSGLFVWSLAVRHRYPSWARGVALAGGVVGGIVVGALLITPDLVWRLRTETDRDWYVARYEAPATVTVSAGERVRVPVKVINQGVRTWLPDAPFPVSLSYHLRRPDGTVVTYDGPRTPVQQRVPPGGAVTLLVEVEAPPTPGRYVVEWDMVREGLMWFSWKASPTGQTELVTLGPPVPEPASWKPTPLPSAPHLAEPVPARPELWRVAWQMVQERPLLGYGPDTFRLRYGAYLGYTRWNRGVHANNLYLELLAGTGWLGIVAFLFFAWRLVGAITKALQAVDTAWGHAPALALVAWLVHGLADAFLAFTPTLVAFWFAVGLLAAGVRGEPRRAP